MTMRLYIFMAFGLVGTVMIGLAGLRFLSVHDTKGFLSAFLGFVLIVNYSNYLENKAGISKKVIWIKSIISSVLFISIGSFLYL
ncbi:hypothetical protein FZW96_07950 [Bacillus sp. BGMRC 2118]|nr:hypothetical protein FZW96_07950 [Bacillus sp. BGMRC 2118]